MATTLTGSDLRSLRTDLGLTCTDLAGVLGIGRGMVSAWESQTRPIPRHWTPLLDLIRRQADLWRTLDRDLVDYGQRLVQEGIPACVCRAAVRREERD